MTFLRPTMVGGVNVTDEIDPEDIPSLQTYFNASDLSTLWQDDAGTIAVTTNGDPVGAWDDKMGNVNAATQGTSSKKPTYNTGGGNPYLQFDGGDLLKILGSTAQFNYLHNGNGGTVVGIVQIDSGWTSGVAFATNNNANTSSNIGINCSANYSGGFHAHSIIVSRAGPAVTYWRSNYDTDFTTGVPHMAAWGYKDGASPEEILDLDDISQLDHKVAGPNAPVTSDATNDMVIGSRTSESSVWLKGRIYSLAFFDEALPRRLRLGVTKFLGREAGLNV